MLIYPVNGNYVVIKREEEEKNDVISDSESRTRCGLRSSDAPSLWFVDLHARHNSISWIWIHFIGFQFMLYIKRFGLIYVDGVYTLCMEYESFSKTKTSLQEAARARALSIAN